MDIFYCRECAAKRGLGNTSTPDNLTGTNYQQEKFFKHTVHPTASGSTISVLDNPDYENYAGLINSAIMFGAIALNRGRESIVYAAGKQVGTTYSSGFQRPDSALRVVCPNHEQKIHGYSTASDQILSRNCADCGKPLFPTI